MGRSADYSKQRCAIAASLDVIGEPWTLLIIRDAFAGLCRFEQWQEALGLARNVLAARLKHLVAEGVFEQRLYCERPRRYEYVLTAKGRELQSMIDVMQDWGQRNVYGNENPAEKTLGELNRDRAAIEAADEVPETVADAPVNAGPKVLA